MTCTCQDRFATNYCPIHEKKAFDERQRAAEEERKERQRKQALRKAKDAVIIAAKFWHAGTPGSEEMLRHALDELSCLS